MKVNAQTPNWTQTYGSAFNDYGYSIEKTYDGGYIIGGTASDDEDKKDILLLKLNTDGDTMWTRNLGSTHNDESYCVKPCRDSGFIVCGYKSNGSNSLDFYIIKTNASGTLVWNRTYGGALNEGSYSIIQTMDDGFAVCGYTGSTGSGGKDMLLLKYDADGDMMWQKTYGGTFDEIAYALLQIPDSGYFIAGTSKSYNNNTLNDVYCVRTNAAGDTLWTKDYLMEGNDFAYSATLTNGNYFLVAGKSNTATNQVMYQPLALKINQEGDVIFSQTYDLGSDVTGCAYSVKEMPDLSYMLVGSITNPTNGQGNDVLALKIGEWGEAIDQQSYGSNYDQEARSFCIDDNENIVTMGKTATNSNGWDIYLSALPVCKRYYARYVWLNNIYNKAVSQYNILDTLSTINTTRLNQLTQYLKTLKYSGVVVTHMEDIFNSNHEAHLLGQMEQVIAQLHKAGIPIALNQFRSNEIERNYVVSSNKMYDFLKRSNTYNQTVADHSRFNGLELDYEFWQDGYGNVAAGAYTHIASGDSIFRIICDSFRVAKSDTANHYKILSMWIGTVFACNDYDVNLNGIPNERADDSLLMHMFAEQRFDRMVLSFFLKDELDSADNISSSPNENPLAYLLRPPAPNEPNRPNQYFARLYYLGQDSIRCNVVPQFHSGLGADSTARLQNFLNGQGSYWQNAPNNGAKNYLHQAEEEFVNQFFSSDTMIWYDQGLFGAERTWGNANITKGFEWFRYLIGPLDYDSLSTRLDDGIKAVADCELTFRNGHYTSNTLETITKGKSIAGSITAVVSNTQIELTIKGYEAQPPHTLRIECYDVTGRLLPQFVITDVQVDESTHVNLQRNGNNGLLFFKVYEGSVCLGVTKVLILNK